MVNAFSENTGEKQQHKLLLLALLIIFAFTYTLVTTLTPFGAATTPDSLSYLDIAANIKEGKGALATDYMMQESSLRSLKEQRAWPPLYPQLLSIVVDNARDVASVSTLSKYLAFACVFFVFLLIASRTSWKAALIASLLLLITVPNITVYSYAWSETLFLALLMMGIWSAHQCLIGDKQTIWLKASFHLLLLAALIALAYTRYIGVVFVVLLPVTYLLGKRSKTDLALFVCSSTIYALLVGYLLHDNYSVTGSLSGVPRSVSDKTLFQNLIDVSHAFLATLPDSPVPIVLSCLVALLVIYAARKTGDSEAHRSNRNDRRLMLLLLIACLLYMVSLISLSTISQFDALDIRLLSSAFVMGFVLLAILPSYFDIRSKSGFAISLICISLIMLSSAKGYQQFVLSIKNWQEYGSPLHLRTLDGIYNNFTRPSAINAEKALISGLVGKGGVLATDRPLVWEFMSGVQCVQRPGKLDINSLRKLNALPSGSVLLVSKPDFVIFLGEQPNQFAYKSIDLGNLIAVQLPLEP